MHKLSTIVCPTWNSIRSMSISRCGGEMVKAECWPKPDYGPMEVHRSEFLNGMKIAAGKPLGHQMAACTILFQAGSRNEVDCEIGVSHFLRAASVNSGMGISNFLKSRYLQQHGGYLTCSSDRQTVSYTLRCPQPVFDDLKCYLLDGGIRCNYPDYELTEVKKMVKEDLTRRPPIEHVLDLVQKACFGGPLSNSVYCPSGRINRINSDILNNYVSTFFKTNVCSIGSLGIGFEEVLKVAAHIDCGRVERPPDYCGMMSYPRGGYEFYDKGPGGDTYIALAVPGTGICDFNSCVKHAIVAAACGLGNSATGSHEWDRNPPTPLSGLVYDAFTDFRAFNISYCDTGVWGIVIKTRSKMARCATFNANEFIGNLGCLSYNDIRIGKRRLQLGVTLNDDTCVRASENLAMQAAYGMSFDNAKQLINYIDGISEEEILAVANCLAAKRGAGQLALAVVGDVEAAPHDGELL